MSAVKATKAAPGVKLMPVRELMAVHMERHGIPNTTVAHHLGYASPNVIAMLRAGTMKLPMNKITPLANILHIDPVYLARCVNAENGFHLEELIEAISRRTAITLNEEKLIQAMRAAAGGIDVDLDSYPLAQETIIDAYTAAAQHQAEDNEGLLRALKNKPRSALANLTAEKLKAKEA